MGQKVNPKSFRLGTVSSWASRWFAPRREYAAVLHRDITLRRAIEERLVDSGLSRIEIERTSNDVKVHIFTSKPGIIIGRQGASIEELRADLSHRFGERIEVNIVEIKKPDADAKLIAENIARQIERRMPYRRIAKMAVTRAMENGLQGVKVRVAGRLNGADISRAEFFKEGNIPLHTIRADVDYAMARANTTYGVIGIKVWTCRGEVFDKGAALSNDNASWLAESRKPKKEAAEEKGRLEEELIQHAA